MSRSRGTANPHGQQQRYTSMPDPQQQYSTPIINVPNMPISTIQSLSTPHGAPAASPANGSSRGVDPRNLSFDQPTESTLEQIIVRQLNEDLQAYKRDLDYCNSEMNQMDITPQEMRTLQLRVLDLTHSMRHSKHRIEQLQFEIRTGGSTPASGSTAALGKGLSYAQTSDGAFASFPRPEGAAVKRPGAGLTSRSGPAKRARPSAGNGGSGTPSGGAAAVKSDSRGGNQGSPANTSPFPDTTDDDDEQFQRTLMHGNNSLQRLGYWKCRLCRSPKYVANKNTRQPATPCKWPLKDVAKMIAHFTELHTEHEPHERLCELAEALHRNRGPLQYWLSRSHAQDVGDGSIVDEVVNLLYQGQVPNVLRKLSRAAAAFPGAEA